VSAPTALPQWADPSSHQVRPLQSLVIVRTSRLWVHGLDLTDQPGRLCVQIEFWRGTDAISSTAMFHFVRSGHSEGNSGGCEGHFHASARRSASSLRRRGLKFRWKPIRISSKERAQRSVGARSRSAFVLPRRGLKPFSDPRPFCLILHSPPVLTVKHWQFRARIEFRRGTGLPLRMRYRLQTRRVLFARSISAIWSVIADNYLMPPLLHNVSSFQFFAMFAVN
jgi:hypothetical protein